MANTNMNLSMFGSRGTKPLNSRAIHKAYITFGRKKRASSLRLELYSINIESKPIVTAIIPDNTSVFCLNPVTWQSKIGGKAEARVIKATDLI